MSSRRTLILVVAILIGGLASFAVYQYVNGIEDRAYDNAQRVEVFVVRQDVAKGLPGEQAIDAQMVQADQIPRDFRPGTALTDINTIRGKVALSNLSAGQVVVDGMFVDPRAAFVSFSQRIDPGLVAITLSIDETRGVAGLIVPGDRVNMIADSPEGKQHLYQNVEVLAIGAQAAPEPGDTAVPPTGGAGLMTFAVPPLAAQRLAFATDGAASGGSGSIYLTLVPPDNVPVDVPPTNGGNLFGDELTPYDNTPGGL